MTDIACVLLIQSLLYYKTDFKFPEVLFKSCKYNFRDVSRPKFRYNSVILFDFNELKIVKINHQVLAHTLCFGEILNKDPFKKLHSTYCISLELLAWWMLPYILQVRLFEEDYINSCPQLPWVTSILNVSFLYPHCRIWL